MDDHDDQMTILKFFYRGDSEDRNQQQWV
jgi:hypothetical protein